MIKGVDESDIARVILKQRPTGPAADMLAAYRADPNATRHARLSGITAPPGSVTWPHRGGLTLGRHARQQNSGHEAASTKLTRTSTIRSYS